MATSRPHGPAREREQLGAHESAPLYSLLGSGVAILVAAGLLLAIAWSLIGAGTHAPLAHMQAEPRVGIPVELIVISLIVFAVLIPGPVRSSDWAARVAALRARSIGPWLPLLLIGVLVGLGRLFWWSWMESYFSIWRWDFWVWALEAAPRGDIPSWAVARVLGAVLLVPFTFAVAILYPRTAAITAGMLTVPTIFVVLAMATRALAGPSDSEVFPFLLSWMRSIGVANAQVTHVEALIFHVAGGAALAALIAIEVARQRRLVPDVFGHVVWTGMLALPLTMIVYLAGINYGG